jgi:hypothetical protein
VLFVEWVGSEGEMVGEELRELDVGKFEEGNE